MIEVIPAVHLLDGFYVFPTPKSGEIKIYMYYYSLGGATMADYRNHPVTVQTRSQAVARIADRTASQQTLVISDCC